MNTKRDGYYGSVYGNDPEDFYNIDNRFTVNIGYGEEPSYIFYFKKDGIVQKGIDIWEGYIDEIAELIPLENNRFTGLTYYINVGVFENDRWHIDDPELICNQLKAVDISALQAKDSQLPEVYNGLLDFIIEMMKNGNEIDVMRL